MRIAAALAFLAFSLAFAPPRAAAEPPTVLFDEGHGQRFLPGSEGDLQLSGFAAVLRESGLAVRSVRDPLADESLANAQALVISGPFAPFAPAEADAVKRFVSRGGRLAVMLHVGKPALLLIQTLGVNVTRGPLCSPTETLETNPLDFAVRDVRPHEITQGVERVAVFGCWGLQTLSGDSAAIAVTAPTAFIDVDANRRLTPGEAEGALPVAVAGKLGAGQFAVFGDDAMFQNRFLAAHNQELAKRLGLWLAAGKTAP